MVTGLYPLQTNFYFMDNIHQPAFVEFVFTALPQKKIMQLYMIFEVLNEIGSRPNVSKNLIYIKYAAKYGLEWKTVKMAVQRFTS